MSLRFRTVADLPRQAPPEWVWEGRIARSYVTMLGGTGGVGKSSLIASLEVAVLTGKSFLGRATLQGPVLHMDFDTDARAQVPWYERALIGQGIEREVLALLTYGDHEDGGFMDEAGLEKLKAQAIQMGAVLIVIDAFTSAFPTIRGNDAGEVAGVMAEFRQLARETGAAVVVLDHTPKPQAHQPEGRGLLGSTIKSAGARAVLLLSRVPSKDVAGYDVLRLETHKNNLAPVGEPLGIQRVWEDDGLRFEPFDLPDADQYAPLQRAQRTLEAVLNSCAGEAVPRAELLKQVVAMSHVSDTTFKRALSEAIREKTVVSVPLTGRGNPMAYKSALPPADPGPLDSLASNQLLVLDGLDFGLPGGPKSEPGPKCLKEREMMTFDD